MIKWVLFFVATSMAIAGGVSAYQKNQVILKEQLDLSRGVAFDKQRRISAFNLVGKDGTAIDASIFQGKWSILLFGYTYCPDICPVGLTAIKQANLKSIDSDLGTDVQIIMVSVDPKRDTPDKITEYLDYFDQSYIGITAAPSQIGELKKLAMQFNVVYQEVQYKEDNYLVDHSGHLPVVDPNGKFVGFIKMPASPEEISHSFTLLQQINLTNLSIIPSITGILDQVDRESLNA